VCASCRAVGVARALGALPYYSQRGRKGCRARCMRHRMRNRAWCMCDTRDRLHYYSEGRRHLDDTAARACALPRQLLLRTSGPIGTIGLL
jgi:hypothetical protein